MPSFRVGSDDPTSMLWVQVQPDVNYSWYRVFVRLTSDPSSSVFDQWYNASSAFYADVTGLSPNTSYTVNVAYNTSATAAGSQWIGAQTFITSGGAVDYYATLIFNANGGSGAPSSVSNTGESQYVSIMIPYTQPVRTGYTFLGWSLDASASAASYYPGSTYAWYGTTYGYTHTLYAVWADSGGGARIYTGTGWQRATPYVYTSQGWQKASPYIYTSQGWRKGT